MDASSLPLRDIHLPAAINWWPPAPGWWILLSLFFVLALALILFLRARRNKPVTRLAQDQLQHLRSDTTLSDREKIQALSVLLRRVSVSTFPRVDSAGLTGLEWLQFLDKILAEKSFSEGPGRVLLDGPYQTEAEIDLAPVYQVCEKWIAALPKKKLRVVHKSRLRNV